MPYDLVIVESPKKAKHIQSFLGSSYKVVASVGHMYDLPKKQLGIDIKKDFKPTYVIMDDKKDVEKNIHKLAKNANIIYLMADLDREGSGIAKNIHDHLPKDCVVKRATTNEITKTAVKKAIQNAYSMDDEKDLVNAYEARRILDRIVGFRASWPVQQATGGRSAGRCQSVALRILADREKEIQSFIPIIYWPIVAELLTNKKEKIIAEIKVPKSLDISTKEEAEKIINVLKKGPVKVSKYDQNQVDVNPYPPFTTSTLYQAAAAIGISLQGCKVASQSLFENSFCTYIRTDSTNICAEAMTNIHFYIKSNYNNQYQLSKPRNYKSKVKNAQEAHEAIRPTDIKLEKLLQGTDDEKKIYELIWRRTVASQMTPAKVLRSSAEFKCNKYVLGATGSKELFDGFRKVWTYGNTDDRYMPIIKVGDTVDVIDIKTEKKETQPPKRYSEASLTKLLETEGIGRPSTYANIITTILDRGYVEKKKNIFHATELGIRVSDFMVSSDFCFIDTKFTSKMEDDLDEISNGKKNKLEVLNAFWERLKKDLEKAKVVKNKSQQTNFECPECKKNNIKANLLKKVSKFGPFFSCENYKKDGGCKYTASVDENGEPKEKVKKDPPKESQFKCPKCKSVMVERTGPYGVFLGCSAYPKCKTIMDMQGQVKEPAKKKWKKNWKKK